MLHGIDGRYATALFTAAQKQNVVDRVETDLNSIKELMDRDEKFKFFLETPIISREAKKQGVKVAMEKGGYSKITSNFFDTLADNGRLDQTPKIVAAYQQLLMAARGQVSVTVTSAKVGHNRTKAGNELLISDVFYRNWTTKPSTVSRKFCRRATSWVRTRRSPSPARWDSDGELYLGMFSFVACR